MSGYCFFCSTVQFPRALIHHLQYSTSLSLLRALKNYSSVLRTRERNLGMVYVGSLQAQPFSTILNANLNGYLLVTHSGSILSIRRNSLHPAHNLK